MKVSEEQKDKNPILQLISAFSMVVVVLFAPPVHGEDGSETPLPHGNYQETCQFCGMFPSSQDDMFLVCRSCAPKTDRQILNLSKCPAEFRDNIQNCNGTLTCGRCEETPRRSPPRPAVKTSSP